MHCFFRLSCYHGRLEFNDVAGRPESLRRFGVFVVWVITFEVGNMFVSHCVRAGWARAVSLFAVFLSFSAWGGPIQRVPNTTLAMPAALPIYGYSVTNAFGTLNFADPVCITSPPGETNRLFVVERGGTIAV